jgi:cyclopropane fatty-acyl-phospholipid synthase-like methyltransferase
MASTNELQKYKDYFDKALQILKPTTNVVTQNTPPPPPPGPEVFDSVINTGLNDTFSSLDVRVKQNVGLWIIFSVRLDWDSTSDCGGSGTAQNIDEYIFPNGQRVSINATELLREVGCEGESESDRRGVYNFKIKIYANPILPNGRLDTTRSQYIEYYRANIKL